MFIAPLLNGLQNDDWLDENQKVVRWDLSFAYATEVLTSTVFLEGLKDRKSQLKDQNYWLKDQKCQYILKKSIYIEKVN